MQRQTQILKKKKRLKNKSQYLQFIFCSFLNWRYSIDSKYNLKIFVSKKKFFGFQLSHFFSLLFLIFGYKKFENEHKTNNLNYKNFSLNPEKLPITQTTNLSYRDKIKEVFLFWQYLKTNINRKLEISNQKTIFSYWFLPLLGFITFQYIQSSFLKIKNSSRFSPLIRSQKNLSLEAQGAFSFPSKLLDFDTEINKSESLLAFFNLKKDNKLLNSKKKLLYFPKKNKKRFQTNNLNLVFLKNKDQEQINIELASAFGLDQREKKQLKILTKKFFKELGICTSFFSLNKVNTFANNSSQTLFNNLNENNDVFLRPKSLSYLNKNFFRVSSFFWNWYILDSSRNYYKNFYENSLSVNFFKEKSSVFPETLAPLGFLKGKTLPVIDKSKFNHNKIDENLYLKKKEIDNFFDLFSISFKEEKKTNSNKKEQKSLIKKNPVYSYEKAYFLWEMYLKNYSFESRQQLDYFRKIGENSKNTDKLISDNYLFDKLDSLNSLNIFNRTRRFFVWPLEAKNLDENGQYFQVNKEKNFFSKLKSNKQKSNNVFLSSTQGLRQTSLFLKNIIYLQNTNFRSYFFIKHKNKKDEKKQILKKENSSIILASLNLKSHLVKTFCFKLLKDKNNRLNNSYLIAQFQSPFLLKDLKILKEKVTSFLFFEEENTKKVFLSNILFLKQLFLIQQSVKVFDSIEPQINLLENKNIEQDTTSIEKTKIIKYRFPILMSGYPEKYKNLFVFLSNLENTQTYFNREKNKNLYNLNEDVRKPKFSLFKKQHLIKKINAFWLASSRLTKNTRFLPNFQIEVQKIRGLKENSLIIKPLEQKKKKVFDNIKNNKLKTKIKNKFIFFNHTFFFLKKRKNMYMFFDSFKNKIKQKEKKYIKAKFEEKKKGVKKSFFKSFKKQPLYNCGKKSYLDKLIKTKKNFVVSYKSLKFVKSNFLISNFYLARNLNSVFLKDQKQISFLNLLSEAKFSKMFSSFTRFLLNFINKSYYLINFNQGYQRKENREKNLDIYQGSQFKYEKNKQNKIKDYFGILSKLKEFSDLIKTFSITIFYTNFSLSKEKFFLIFKRIKIFVYQKILKNFVFVSLNKKNKKQIFFSLDSSKKSTEESRKKRQFKLKRKTKLIGKQSSLIINSLNKGLIKNFKKNFLLSNLEKRKYEKIFRSYLSCKSETSSLNLKKQKSKKNKVIAPALGVGQRNDVSKKRICNSIKNRILLKNINLNGTKRTFAFFFSLEKKKLPLHLSPNEFLKKKHFIFFTDSYKNFLSSEEKLRLEKTKNFQKKRRLKKQKKETRRRKRRKRFYPRPFWLRFKTYQKFLQIRHFKICIPYETKKQKFLQKKDSVHLFSQKSKGLSPKGPLDFGKKLEDFLKLKSENFQPINHFVVKRVDIYSFKKANGLKIHKNETYLSSLNKNFFSEMKITQEILRKKIYRRNKQKWGHCVYETPLSEKIFLKKSKFLWSLPLLNSRNFYQLSNNLKNDFQRMSWKSYWLRQNLSPYFQRVNLTLENLQKSSIQECFLKNFKSFLLNFLGFNISFIDRESDKYSYLNGNLQNQNFVTLNKLPLPISKIQFKNSIESKFLFTNSSEYSQAVLFSEYQRISYNRMLESFKNIKQNLSGNGLFQPRFFRIGRIKFSSNERHKNFWQKFNNFVNLEVPVSAIQPSGYSTKLRGLWALNKTNLLTFKERNMIRSLWSSVKLRDQNKSKKKSIFKKAFQDLKKVLLNLNIQDLENFYFLKIQNKEQKLDVLGSFLLREKKQPKTFQLKMELKKRNTFFNTKKEQKQQVGEKFIYQPRFFRKRFSNYWWNTEIQKNFLIFSLWPTPRAEADCFLFSDFPYTESPIFLISLWIGTLLIHLALLFFLFSIPEIRSLVKFQILIFYKICLSLTITIYYLYDGLKNWNLRFNVFTSKYQGFLKSNFGDKISIEKQHLSFDNEIKKPLKSVLQLSLEKLNSVFIDKTLSTSNFSNIYSSRKIKNLSLISIKSSLLFFKYNLIIPINIKVLNKKSSFFKELFNFFFSKKSNLYSLTTLWLNGRRKKIAGKTPYSFFIQKIKNKKFYLEYLKFLSLKVFYFLNTKSGFIGGNLGPLTLLTIGSLIIIKNIVQIFYKCFSFFYTIFIKIVDFFENILIIVYKFLEKPAEVLIEWMAQIFLIEWSSNRLVYVPETFDIQIWNSMYKTSRSLRIFSIPTALLIRRVWNLQEAFFKYIYKPDKDLIYRQKKGIFFWDLWVEILLQIADKYNLNIPSLNTLKEEQEFFMEKLLQDQDWDKYSTNVEKINPFYFSQDLFSYFFSLREKNKGKNVKIQKQFKQKNKFPFIGQRKLSKIDKLNTNLSSFKNSNIFVFNLWAKNQRAKSLKFLEENTEINQHRNIYLKNNDRWSFHQDWIFQGRETDLFLDVHPPKSLAEISYLKFTQLSHQPITTFVCQIFSGIFSKQVAKNILLIGPPGLGKSLFIQAMAGETELQMITEHAHRYSLVSRGLAIGMKLLKHVFDSISFSTPCFFLIEDIHLIGEKRPISISDDQNVKALDMSTGYDQEEIHEKNQAIYQLNRHSLNHYKKPSKGDFSLLIPTNHFCFDLFLGVSVPRTRRYLKGPSHPLNIEFIQNQLNNQTEKQQNFSSSDKFKMDNVSNKLVSHLQLPSQKFFSPPPTSPFTLFALKEQQKFQPKKVVKQMPWGGLSWDQMMRKPKTTYSVKTKVAMLAEIARTHFTVKLEMITDLLVLIDNVRSARGFVVFGTTHKPHVLDPALRRPGRFDETISFPYIPNLLTRWQILKTSVSQFSKTLDCLDYAVICKNLHENQLSDFLLRAKFSLSNDDNNLKSLPFGLLPKGQRQKNLDFSRYMDLSNFPETNRPIKSHLSFSAVQLYMRKFIKNSINSETNNFLNFFLFEFFSLWPKPRIKDLKVEEKNKSDKITNQRTLALRSELNLNKNSFSDLNSSFKILLQNSPRNFLPFSIGSIKKEKIANHNLDKKVAQSKSLSTILRRLAFYSFIPSGPSNVLAMTYFHVSKLLIHAKILKDPTSFGLLLFSSKSFEFSQNSSFTTSKLLFSSSNDLSLEFLRLFAGKIGEFFVFSTSTHFKKQKFLDSVKKNKNSQSLSSFADFFANGVYSFYGIDENWRSITSLAFSILQKRYFYSKNLVVSKLLCFDNFSSLKEVLSPPASFCYIPGKRYENLKKVEKDFNQKFSFSLSEKIDLIQQQKLNKKLYNKSIQELFLFPKKVYNSSSLFSEKRNNKEANEMGFNKRFYTNFNVSTRELIPINSSTIRITSANPYYRKRILERHRFSFVNHWWNGHLSEHNVETTFLSDVDWRYSFKESLGDVVIDFPDTEQYYNPRSRRWMLSSGYWADWNSFEKIFNEEISYHYISESFNKAFTFLENYREILDHLAYKLLKNGFLKEIDVLNIFNSFCILKK